MTMQILVLMLQSIRPSSNHGGIEQSRQGGLGTSRHAGTVHY